MTQGYMNTRVENKNTILFATLSQIFGDKMNLARIKFFGLFISALCKAHSIYKERWQIGTAFKAQKTSGFNIEDTHLTDINRINKLFALVMVAFVLAIICSAYS
jgi:hypothetical protein